MTPRHRRKRELHDFPMSRGKRSFKARKYWVVSSRCLSRERKRIMCPCPFRVLTSSIRMCAVFGKYDIIKLYHTMVPVCICIHTDVNSWRWYVLPNDTTNAITTTTWMEIYLPVALHSPVLSVVVVLPYDQQIATSRSSNNCVWSSSCWSTSETVLVIL